MRKETRCRHMGYSFRLIARVLLYAPSHRQDSTYHGFCYTSRGSLAGTRNIQIWKKLNPHTHQMIFYILFESQSFTVNEAGMVKRMFVGFFIFCKYEYLLCWVSNHVGTTSKTKSDSAAGSTMDLRHIL